MLEHSKKFETVKMLYETKQWSITRVRLAVEMEWITAGEYKEITGEDYPEPNE